MCAFTFLTVITLRDACKVRYSLWVSGEMGSRIPIHLLWKWLSVCYLWCCKNKRNSQMERIFFQFLFGRGNKLSIICAGVCMCPDAAFQVTHPAQAPCNGSIHSECLQLSWVLIPVFSFSSKRESIRLNESWITFFLMDPNAKYPFCVSKFTSGSNNKATFPISNFIHTTYNLKSIFFVFLFKKFGKNISQTLADSPCLG